MWVPVFGEDPLTVITSISHESDPEIDASVKPLEVIPPNDHPLPHEMANTHLTEEFGQKNNPYLGIDNGWWCSREYNKVLNDEPALLKLTRKHLDISRKYLEQSDNYSKVKGIAIALQVARCAKNILKNSKLAESVCSQYIIPNIKALPKVANGWLDRDKVVSQMIHIYTATHNKLMLIESYKLLLVNAPNANTADAANFRIALLYIAGKDYGKATKYLNAISKDSGFSDEKARIAKTIPKK